MKDYTGHGCKYNPEGVRCSPDGRHCESCGHNPAVAAARLQKRYPGYQGSTVRANHDPDYTPPHPRLYRP